MVVMPTEFSLSPAYPNPFNPVTTLSFALPKESDVSILIYNIQGRLVETLTDSKLEIGYHSVIWNANHHASGL
jgi:flagellar hook assembly protein FlgD